jgi:signal transduction histidine kinase
MLPLRLRTELLIANLLIICTLTGVILFIVRHTVRSEIDQEVRQGTDASVRAFQSVERERELQLSRTAALLAELPPLKALMTTDDPLTIQDGSERFWQLAGSDLFVLADSEGKVLGFHVKKTGWEPRTVESDLKKLMERGEKTAWWYADGQLYWVFLNPIMIGTESGGKQIGMVAVGYQVDSTVADHLALGAGSQIVLAAGGNVIASTLPGAADNELQRWVAAEGARPDTETREMKLEQGQFQVASVLIHSGPPAPVRCYVLMSLESANSFLRELNRTIFVVGISAILFAALLLNFFSRTITRPLDNLVAGVRALAAGDYAYSITPRGSSEVAELGDAFSRMRDELLAAQQRWIATERIAALGRAASSISHDLRHYLSAVVANAEFLYEAEKLKLNRDEIYNEIKTASDQMTDLIDSLREVAREGTSITPVPASLDQIAHRAVEAVVSRPELRSRKVVVHTTGEMTGVFDPKKIERAIFNLVLNACEATVNWQGEIQVEIASNHDFFEIRVADNGRGIPANIQGTLFDPFVSSGKPNGTGMGLAIVNKIIQDHEGQVSVEQTSSTGTIFLVKLPRRARPAAISPEPAVISRKVADNA